MTKPLVIPDKCPIEGCCSEVDVDKHLDGWVIVRCVNRNCNWWDQGRLEE